MKTMAIIKDNMINNEFSQKIVGKYFNLQPLIGDFSSTIPLEKTRPPRKWLDLIYANSYLILRNEIFNSFKKTKNILKSVKQDFNLFLSDDFSLKLFKQVFNLDRDISKINKKEFLLIYESNLKTETYFRNLFKPLHLEMLISNEKFRYFSPRSIFTNDSPEYNDFLGYLRKIPMLEKYMPGKNITEVLKNYKMGKKSTVVFSSSFPINLRKMKKSIINRSWYLNHLNSYKFVSSMGGIFKKESNQLEDIDQWKYENYQSKEDLNDFYSILPAINRWKSTFENKYVKYPFNFQKLLFNVKKNFTNNSENKFTSEDHTLKTKAIIDLNNSLTSLNFVNSVFENRATYAYPIDFLKLSFLKLENISEKDFNDLLKQAVFNKFKLTLGMRNNFNYFLEITNPNESIEKKFTYFNFLLSHFKLDTSLKNGVELLRRFLYNNYPFKSPKINSFLPFKGIKTLNKQFFDKPPSINKNKENSLFYKYHDDDSPTIFQEDVFQSALPKNLKETSSNTPKTGFTLNSHFPDLNQQIVFSSKFLENVQNAFHNQLSSYKYIISKSNNENTLVNQSFAKNLVFQDYKEEDNHPYSALLNWQNANIYSSYPKMEHFKSLNPEIVNEKVINQHEISETSYPKPGTPEIDVNQIADQVYSVIERKIMIEKERRGLFG
ncbi:hypothetical protein [Methanobacterium formicicum]|uniref:hypothetical protein n=1 Tax=Methanobacterium formicicum TaxID=2162 RepID=UPI002412D0C7|nr:hypothetical protein [Methanobacterium formicicum]MDG3548133.1 hypothetical protein [Methanobacterium formicicum]